MKIIQSIFTKITEFMRQFQSSNTIEGNNPSAESDSTEFSPPDTDHDPKLEQKVNALENKWEAMGVDVDTDKARQGIRESKEHFRLSIEEASKLYEAQVYERNDDITPIEQRSKYGDRLITEFNSPEVWGDITVTVSSLWEAYSDDIQDIGLVQDISGSKKFTLWKQAGKQSLEEGKTYHITNVVGKPYNDNVEIKITKNSVIKELPDARPINRHNVSGEFGGRVVRVLQSSGAITRCDHTECSRVLKNGKTCPEHGETSGYTDARIIAVIDDGNTTCRVVFDAEDTKEITGKTIAAMDREDENSLQELIENKLLGEYVNLTLSQISTDTTYQYVRSYQLNPPVDKGKIDQMLITSRDIMFSLEE